MKKRTFKCKIEGTEELMFDRVAFDPVKTGKILPLKWDEKVYLGRTEETKENLVMPTTNIFSLLTNTRDGAPFLKEKKAAEAKRQCIAVKRCIRMMEPEVLITRDGNPLTIKDCYHHQSSAPDPSKHSPILTSRPVLPLKWEVEFSIQIIEMMGITAEGIYNYLELGGMMVGLGTNRGQYGKFDITEWEEIK